jgi:maleylacetate reductase
MLPAVMQWNKPANAERQAMVATAMGKGDEDASVLLKRLINGLGLPIGLSDVKIAPKDFDAIAAQSMKTPWVPRNPRPIERPSQICEILDLAK